MCAAHEWHDARPVTELDVAAARRQISELVKSDAAVGRG
jgi:hypothetical protein